MKASEAFLLHGEMVSTGLRQEGNYRETYVGVLKSVETGEKEFLVVPDPKVDIYIARPQFRTNTIKKECERKDHCDVYKTPTTQIASTIFRAINGRNFYGYLPEKKMLSDPYVYAADIEYAARLKFALNKTNHGKRPQAYNVGHLDIETDVTGSEQIILITFMNGDGNTYVGVLKEFFTKGVVVTPSDTKEDIERKNQELIDKRRAGVDKLWAKTEREFRGKLSDEARDIYDKSDSIKIHLNVCDTEVSLIRWIFDKIHESKPDFITIWNIAYDIPYIMNRLKFRGVDPTTVFCHPDVPRQFRKCDFHLDKGKKDSHITDLWSWLHCTDYSCWLDAMCLYGRLRKAKGRDSSYKLNDIGAKEIGAGKLEFGDGEGHYDMQMKHQVEYTVYNVVDVLILRVMELKNKDVFNLVMLSGDSMMDEFNHEAIKLKNSFFVYLDGKGMVPGTVGETLDQEFDKWLHNRGGAVLDPERSFANIAVASLRETDDVGRVCRFVCDLDVTSEYPSCDMAFNITRETKLATVLNIDNTNRAGKIIDVNDVRLEPNDPRLGEAGMQLKNIDVNSWFLAAIYVKSNVMRLAKTFSLPSYDEVDAIIAQKYPELCTDLVMEKA